MASHAPHFGSASALPLSAVLGAIPSYPRPVIERLVARLIERLDEQDGDDCLELGGDEADGTNAEDEEGNNHLAYGGGGSSGAGCPFSDPGEDENDAEAELPEWAVAAAAYGIDQRIAAVGHGYAAWHIDREQPL